MVYNVLVLREKIRRNVIFASQTILHKTCIENQEIASLLASLINILPIPPPPWAMLVLSSTTVTGLHNQHWSGGGGKFMFSNQRKKDQQVFFFLDFLYPFVQDCL